MDKKRRTIGLVLSLFMVSFGLYLILKYELRGLESLGVSFVVGMACWPFVCKP